MLIKHYNLKNCMYNLKKKNSWFSSAVGIANSMVEVLVWQAWGTRLELQQHTLEEKLFIYVFVCVEFYFICMSTLPAVCPVHSWCLQRCWGPTQVLCKSNRVLTQWAPSRQPHNFIYYLYVTIWRAENNFVGPFFFFHLYVSSGFKLGCQACIVRAFTHHAISPT